MKFNGLKSFALAVVFFFSSLAAAGSWIYNRDSGIGIYQPEGWRLALEGRLTRLMGPLKDGAQSEITVGSDWNSSVHTLEDIKRFMTQMTEFSALQPAQISGLKGFAAGNVAAGALFVMRQDQNIIEVMWALRGSKDQISEGQQALSSIDIRVEK